MRFIVHTENMLVKRFPFAFDNYCVYNTEMKFKRRGRPPKPVPEKREERLDLRVSQAEKQAFKLAAAQSQEGLSVWIRVQLHKAASEELERPLATENGAGKNVQQAEHN